MNIKSLLLGSVAAVAAVSGARAADAVFLSEPEAVEYVRVCDAYGTGFFYIPGTQTCLKAGGMVRYDAKAGDDVYTGADRDTWGKRTRAEIRFDARSETELGTLRSYIVGRFQYDDGLDSGGSIPTAFIELGGFRVGVDDEIFGSWTGYAGNIINDDVINYQSGTTNQISFTFSGGNGFSAIIAAEQGSDEFGYDYVIDDYLPHLLAGAKFEQAWGGISGIVGYDSVKEDIAAKLRLDVSFNEAISAWVMGGYQSDYRTSGRRNWFGTWEGDWAAWGGVAVKVTDKATVNGQLAYESEGTWASALNVSYQVVPGFTVTPELNYTKFDGARGTNDAFGGIIRFQRNF